MTLSALPTPPTRPEPEGDDTTLALGLSLLNRVRRHLWLTALVAFIVIGLGAVQVLKRPVFYQSTMSLMLQNHLPRVLDKVTEVYAEELMADFERFVNGQVRLLQSHLTSEAVEQKLKLPKGELAGRLAVTLERNSNVANISVQDLDPARAKLLVQAFADVYIASTVSDRTGVATKAATFLGGEAVETRRQLEQDEQALYRFQSQNELPGSNFEASHKIASSTLEALHARAAQARTESIKLAAQLEEIVQAGHDRNLRRQLTLPAAGEHWGMIQGRRALLIEQANQLETHYGPSHPKLKEVHEALAAVEAMLDTEVDTAIAAVRAHAHENESELRQLRKAIDEETKGALVLRQKELTYNRLQRQLDEDRETYSLVAKREREAELQAAVKDTYVKRLDGPSEPVSLGRSAARDLTLFCFIGILLGLLAALVLDLLNDSIKSPFEAERDLEQPLLGIMMSIPPGEGDPEVGRAEHLIKHPRSITAEQCHSLTTQIYSLFNDLKPRVLMVASASVEDGKTLTAVNLASTVAARGKRVLLIDADLRRGRMHRIFRLNREGGLYELVAERITLEQATRRTWIPNVDIITTGEIPYTLSPLRVLEHKDLEKILEQLKGRYDLILIDTAPTPLVSDALLLGGLVDGAIGVLRVRKTSRALTRKLAEHLLAARVPFLGWVLNDIPEAELKSKYYYRYGYGRGYGYEKRSDVA
jgi:capsular exopolysaccharide synthesis family protein